MLVVVAGISLPPPPRVMCDVIGPGTLGIVFGRSADLGNPARVGRYTSEETVGNLRSRGEARRSKTAGGAAAIELFTSTAPRP
jgi:hypothetical protein